MKRTLIVFSMILSISALAADKEKRLTVGKADSYPTKQAQGQVTVAAIPYVNDDELKEAFGKANPYKFGILPVMVVIQNDSNKALRIDLKTEYVDSQGRHIDAIAAQDVGYEGKAPSRPRMPGTTPIPLPKKKNPMLSSWEIVGRAFSARMVPAGESVSGFVYFHTELQQGAQLYLNGLSEAQSGKELFYFEIPLTK